jgi:2-oxoglutarate dehydrogenase E2 component (dihydrolipoamide succinyltransferase)
MAKVELVMPKMGESIMEATIIKWHKSIGQQIDLDETILEIATDKVDSEIPSPVSGKVVEIFYKENDIVPIGTIIALIATEGEEMGGQAPIYNEPQEVSIPSTSAEEVENTIPFIPAEIELNVPSIADKSDRFYSPLVRNMAKEENISFEVLESIVGTGSGGRLTKNDLLNYISTRNSTAKPASSETIVSPQVQSTKLESPKPILMTSGDVEIIEMDRMRKLIADHMVMSKRVSPHVTSFVEADVTNLVKWREANKDEFFKKYGEKITFTPLFIEAIVEALKAFPKVNCSVVDDKIHVFKNLNIGMATALPSGNLIVPVIKSADQLNLLGLTKQVNDLAARARDNKLKPDEIKDGTFTVTNVGTFGNVMGTPIINQPQAAILALGAIRKKPAVLETEEGDVIAIRHMMFMSLSYDHRIIDGFLGGSFLRKIADIIEAFDSKRIL